MHMKERISRLCVAGGTRLFREALSKSLACPDIVVAGTCESVAGFLAAPLDPPPDILLASCEGAETVTTAAIEHLCAELPALRVVLLLDDPALAELGQWIRTPIAACVQRTISTEALRATLRLALAGERVFLADVIPLLLGRVADGEAAAAAPAASALSDGELRILARLAIGEPNKQIARGLGISEPTVKLTVRNILRKLGVANRTQAAIWAYQRGIGT